MRSSSTSSATARFGESATRFQRTIAPASRLRRRARRRCSATSPSPFIPTTRATRISIGRTVRLPPLLERAIPIIADDAVDPEFGTGAVKVTPAHDPVDYEIGVRHALAMPSVIGLDARIKGDESQSARTPGSIVSKRAPE